MVRGLSLLTVLLLAGLPGDGQIILGGPGVGYPGGGGPFPGGRRQRGTNGPSQQGGENNQTTLVGTLRNLTEKNAVIEDDDKNVTIVTITGSTKYLTTSGAKGSSGDFQPGDRISISTTQDSKTKSYRAHEISMVRVGSADDHSLASLHTDDMAPLPRASDSNPSASSTGSSPGSSNKPVLRRAESSADESRSSASRSASPPPDDNDPDRPRLRRASGSSSSSDTSASNSSASDSSSGPPRMRRAVSSSDESGPRAEIGPGDSSTPSASASSPRSSPSLPPSSGSDSDGPPRLRRSSPPSGNDSTVAEARPSLHADDVNGATRLPAEPKTSAVPDRDAADAGRYARSSGDEVIDKAREAAFSFTETLPNFVVKQYTTRYASAPTRGRGVSWQALDTVTADVIEEDGHEKYKNILVNGKTPREDVEHTGSWSTGEFSSLQLSVLLPQTNADFRNKRSVTINNRGAFRYDFSVEKANSHWMLETEGQKIEPAYTGSIWIDKETYRALRLELQAQNLPPTFPTDQAENTVDYDFVLIGEGKFLLPTRAEMLGCARGTNNCTRNVIEFRNYKKFTADTSITFDPDK